MIECNNIEDGGIIVRINTTEALSNASGYCSEILFEFDNDTFTYQFDPYLELNMEKHIEIVLPTEDLHQSPNIDVGYVTITPSVSEGDGNTFTINFCKNKSMDITRPNIIDLRYGG